MSRYYSNPSMWHHMEDVSAVLGGTERMPYKWADRLHPGVSWLDPKTGWGRRIVSFEGDRVHYLALPEKKARDCSASSFLHWQDKYGHRVAPFDEVPPQDKGQLKLPF